MDNQQAIELIKKGDRSFFRTLYQSISESCTKYIVKRGGDATIAEEVLHEALYRFFVRVKEKEDFKINTSVESVVFGFIKMVWKQKCRQSTKYKLLHQDLDDENKYLKETLSHEEDELIMDNNENSDHTRIMALMEKLGKDCKELLIAFYVHKQSLQIIAEELSFTYDYAKLKRFRCVAELKKKFLKTV